jgi:NADH-quinone oxidoreductase subunit C
MTNNQELSCSTINAYIQANIPSLVQFTSSKDLETNCINLFINSKDLKALLAFLHKDDLLQFVQMLDIWAVDYPNRTNRFELNYMLLSIKSALRIWIHVMIENDSMPPSVSDQFQSANWFEREIWDMFGIFFIGHPSLRRILTDYGFEGFPLRKDFPLTGYFEVRYDDTQKRVVNEPIKITQEFRVFSFSSPWENNK